MPLLVVGMCSAAVLRSAGDPRRAMYVTLTGRPRRHGRSIAIFISLARIGHPRAAVAIDLRAHLAVACDRLLWACAVCTS